MDVAAGASSLSLVCPLFLPIHIDPRVMFYTCSADRVTSLLKTSLRLLTSSREERSNYFPRSTKHRNLWPCLLSQFTRWPGPNSSLAGLAIDATLVQLPAQDLSSCGSQHTWLLPIIQVSAGMSPPWSSLLLSQWLSFFFFSVLYSCHCVKFLLCWFVSIMCVSTSPISYGFCQIWKSALVAALSSVPS